MPLSINVGLSRKASRDYQSHGVSINVTAELDQCLLARPDELQQEIAGLYAQAEQALDRQTATHARSEQPPPHRSPQSPRSNSNGRNGNGHGGGMTESQRKAILAIAHRANLDAAYEADQIIGTPLDDLSVRQASELIDHLKSIAPANGR